MDRVGLVLCIDIGNRNVKSGIFENGNLVKAFEGFPSAGDLRGVNAVVFSSVSPQKEAKLVELLGSSKFEGEILRISAAHQKHLKVNYTNPGELGDDRVAFSFYLCRKYGNGLGIDAGTFVNAEWVKDGVHYPMVIFPGIHILKDSYGKGERLKGLNVPYSFETLSSCEDLSFLRGESKELEKVLPRSTEGCAIMGLILSLYGIVNGLIQLTGEKNIVFTGGDGEILKELVGLGVYEKHAVLLGLYEYYSTVLFNSKL
ncbi:MAG TPA: type III pantothenate kinase [Candidatus Hydrothermia bacterium]|nr:type III pantothenate kinase [Candidatus Hydrothermia bacterium]MDD5572670.1 type III pantothenate kinase [Candidatus Hydrothermia bacterium]HRD22579.1 type III pantothenate kinase [Candidatus Hydrothermia bacterium]